MATGNWLRQFREQHSSGMGSCQRGPLSALRLPAPTWSTKWAATSATARLRAATFCCLCARHSPSSLEGNNSERHSPPSSLFGTNSGRHSSSGGSSILGPRMLLNQMHDSRQELHWSGLREPRPFKRTNYICLAKAQTNHKHKLRWSGSTQLRPMNYAGLARHSSDQ